MRLPRIATVLGGLLLSRRGGGFAGRHAGKLALVTLAYEMWRRHQAKKPGAAPRTQPHGRSRWSGRARR
ncbi:hypothetical protein D3C71_1470500 [compost metagenome]